MLERSLCVLATLFAGATATAQYWRPIPISPLVDPQPIATDTVAGNFTGHDCLDFAFRLGTQIVLCTAPSIHNATTPIADWVTNPTALATIPGHGDHGRDALAIATSTGLLQWKRGATSTTTLDPGVDWRTVACGDLDGNAPVDFVGVVGIARDRLRFVLRNGTSVDCLETTFAGQTIASVVLAQWNDSAPVEVAVATEQRLWVGTPTATLRQLVIANDGGSHLASLRMESRHHLAWAVRVGGEPRLYGVSRLAQSMTLATGLGGATHMAAGDIDKNAADDLVFTGPGMVPKLVMNIALSTANVAEFDVANMSSMAPPMNPQPIDQAYGAARWGDIDSDGSDDLYVPWQMTNSSAVTSGTVWLYMQAIGLEPRPRLAGPAVIASGSATEHTFTLKIDPDFPPPTAPMQATHIELLVFAARASNGVIALVPEGLQRVPAAVPLANDEVSFSVPIVPDMPRAFAVAARWVTLSGSTVQHVWTPTRIAFAMDGEVLPYTLWREGRRLEAIPGLLLWPPPPPPAPQLYFLRPLAIEPGSQGGGIYTSHSGDEEPPDLPPPPPEPPKPPAPPPE